MKLTETQEQFAIGTAGWLAIGLVAVMLLNGCASKPATVTPDDTIRAGMADGAIKAANTPLFKMTCSPSCTFASLEIANPGAAAQMAEVVKVAMTPQPSEASQNYRATVAVLGQVGTYGVIGAAVKGVVSRVVGGFEKGFDTNAEIAKKIPQPGAVTTNITNTTTTADTTTTLSGTGFIGSGS